MQAGKYVAALMTDLPRKNGWTVAEHAGDATPDRMQRLLNHAVWDHAVWDHAVWDHAVWDHAVWDHAVWDHAVWDHEAAIAAIRGLVTEVLGNRPLRVAAVDESGQQKQGRATAGVQRQYMGCAGRVANGVNTVYCSYATDSGHALVGAKIYVPVNQLNDPDRRAALGIGDDVVFRTKWQLATDIFVDMVAEGTMPPWCAADEVYGRAGDFRAFLEGNGTGYVVRVGCAFQVDVASGPPIRADDLVRRFLLPESWQICSVAGSKGERAYAWAWVGTASPRHFLLIRQHLDTGELAYHYCYVPPGEPIQFMTLVRVACLRWPVEEDFEFGKDQFGLDQSQVRLYTALFRHIVLTMAALAVCAITATQAKTRASAPVLPHTPDDQPPPDIGMIALTIAEIKRLFALVTRQIWPDTHHLHWNLWRRRHQTRARWFHHRTRLRRQHQPA